MRNILKIKKRVEDNIFGLLSKNWYYKFFLIEIYIVNFDF